MQSNGSPDVMGALDHLLTVTEFYAKKVEEKGDGVETLQHVMKLIADEIEANGMHGGTEMGVVLPMQVKPVSGLDTDTDRSAEPVHKTSSTLHEWLVQIR